MEIQIPNEVKKLVTNYVERLEKKGFDRSTVLQDIYKIATDPNILSDFNGDMTAAWVYAAERVYVRYSSRKENLVVAKKLIPIGITQIRKTGTGVDRASIYAVAQFEGEAKPKLIDIVAYGSFANIVEKLPLYRVYQDIVLSSRGGFYEVTSQTNFPLDENPGLNVDPIEFIQRLGFRKIKMSEFHRNLSKLINPDKGWADPFDLRYFEGYVVRPPRKGQTDKGQYGVYDISDGTLEEDYVSPDGSVIVPVSVTVWCAPRFCVYDVESKVGVLGTIQVGRSDNTVFVNAIYIHPIVVTGILE